MFESTAVLSPPTLDHAPALEPGAATIARFKRPDPLKSGWQIANTFLPLVVMWGLMYWSLSWSYWLTLLLAVPAAGFRVRLFIIQHDCGHQSFFRSRWANDLVGFIGGLITLTPYRYWKRSHALHHANSGSLTERGYGDVETWTVDEYLAKNRWWRLGYRVYRHPLVLFFFGAIFLFVIRHRFTMGVPRSWTRERRGIHASNLAILAVLALAWWTIGLSTFLLIEAPVVVFASVIGAWLFYVQHQFEHAYWQPRASWDFSRAALEGSSYYRLPAVLQWFTGNIGFHHIHHLNSRIPNYHLPACYAAEPSFRQAVTFGFWESLRCTRLKLWDERGQRMVSFAEAHLLSHAAVPS
jgi:omega-6 fatty acid desaturase (delta-12 desaturase)